MGRTGIITFLGNGLTLDGPELKAGDKAPDFTVLDNELNPVSLNDFSGKVKIISVTPSLDTPVCDAQLRKFNEEAAKVGDNIVIMNISMDLPFANARFCTTAGIEKVKTYSDHKDASFGMAYGLLVSELRLLTRAIIIIDSKNSIKHFEIVPEITNHPDYNKALEVAKSL